jgi:hypothetical protein
MSCGHSVVRRINEAKQKKVERKKKTANTKTIEEAKIRAVIDNWANALRAKQQRQATESGLVVSRDPRLPQNRREVDDHT